MRQPYQAFGRTVLFLFCARELVWFIASCLDAKLSYRVIGPPAAKRDLRTLNVVQSTALTLLQTHTVGSVYVIFLLMAILTVLNN